MSHLSNDQFLKYQALIYRKTGISITDNKRDILNNRLIKVLNDKNIDNFDELYNCLTIKNEPSISSYFVNVMTTNTTEFFREKDHYKFIQDNFDFLLNKNKRILENREIRIWHAASSSGQEPYTMAMVMNEILKNYDRLSFKSLATDINTIVLKKAIEGEYSKKDIENVPLYYRQKYFNEAPPYYVINDSLKKFITFRHFNIMDDFPFRKGFDIIFCCNMMIYFDKKLQQKLIDKFYNVLSPGGIFLIGHCESLVNVNHSFKYLAPSLYIKD